MNEVRKFVGSLDPLTYQNCSTTKLSNSSTSLSADLRTLFMDGPLHPSHSAILSFFQAIAPSPPPPPNHRHRRRRLRCGSSRYPCSRWGGGSPWSRRRGRLFYELAQSQFIRTVAPQDGETVDDGVHLRLCKCIFATNTQALAAANCYTSHSAGNILLPAPISAMEKWELSQMKREEKRGCDDERASLGQICMECGVRPS